MPKMFIKVKDKETKKVYFFEWSTISDEPNSEAVETDDFVELHHELCASSFPDKKKWAETFARDMIQLGKSNVSNPDYTRGELMSCSDEYKTLESLVEYCKANLKKY